MCLPDDWKTYSVTCMYPGRLSITACSYDSVQATGTEVDLSEHGLGVRSKRYAMLVTDGTVSQPPVVCVRVWLCVCQAYKRVVWCCQ